MFSDELIPDQCAVLDRIKTSYETCCMWLNQLENFKNLLLTRPTKTGMFMYLYKSHIRLLSFVFFITSEISYSVVHDFFLFNIIHIYSEMDGGDQSPFPSTQVPEISTCSDDVITNMTSHIEKEQAIVRKELERLQNYYCEKVDMMAHSVKPGMFNC